MIESSIINPENTNLDLEAWNNDNIPQKNSYPKNQLNQRKRPSSYTIELQNQQNNGYKEEPTRI